MPSGLDGNPNPITTTAREAVLVAVAQRVLSADGRRVAVAVDGRSGAGKSTFGDELAARLAASGVQVVRSTTDSFHRPRAERMRLGPESPDGYYLESHQLDVIANELLEPFTRGEPDVLVAAFDEPTDSPARENAVISERAILIFDGLFLQRPELRSYWDFVVFLEADRRCDEAWLDFLLSDLPAEAPSRAVTLDDRLARARWPRYRAGWRRYVEAVRPHEHASVVVDNNDLDEPTVISNSS